METATLPTQEVRGSQKLLASMKKNGEVPTVEEIKKALALPSNFEMTVPNWLIRGTPASWLQLDGTVRVPIKHLSEVVDKFVKLNDSSITLKILINGTPFPELVDVNVRNTPRGF